MHAKAQAVERDAALELLLDWKQRAVPILAWFAAAGGTGSVSARVRVQAVSHSRLALRGETAHLRFALSGARFEFGPMQFHPSPTLPPVDVEGLQIWIAGPHPHWIFLADAGAQPEKLLGAAVPIEET